MATGDPHPDPESSETVARPSADVSGSPASSGPRVSSRPMQPVQANVLWGWAMTAAVLVGVASWVTGEKFYEYFEIPEKVRLNSRDTITFDRHKAIIDARNTALAFGFLGVSLGLGLGLAGGLARGSLARGMGAGVIGGLVGGAGCVALSYVLMPVFRDRIDAKEPILLLPLAIHGAIWMAAGAAGGLAFGLALGGLSRTVRSVLGGIVGALIGTAVYELLAATVFPLESFEELIGPTFLVRLIGFLCVTLFAAAGTVIMASVSTSRPKTVAAEL
jgi:hypothetical protein